MSEYVRNIGDVAKSLIATVEERQAVGGIDVTGLETGFYKVDTYTGGMEKRDVWLIAARTGCGKTSAALDISLHNARKEKGIIFFSLEMDGERLLNRLVARMTRIDSMKIWKGQLSNDELKRVRLAVEEFLSMNMVIVDQPMSSDEATVLSKKIADKRPIDLVVVDYAGIMTDSGVDELNRLQGISRQMKVLASAENLDVPVLLLAQLNRASELREDHTPKLTDIAGADKFAHDASVVLLLHRPMKGDVELRREENAQIIIPKNRYGPDGITDATFYPHLNQWKQERPLPVQPKTLADKVRQKRT